MTAAPGGLRLLPRSAGCSVLPPSQHALRLGVAASSIHRASCSDTLALFPPLLVLSLKFKASETQTGHVVPPRAQHQHRWCTLRCPQPAERCRRGQGTGDGAAPAPGLPGVWCHCRCSSCPGGAARCGAGCVPGVAIEMSVPAAAAALQTLGQPQPGAQHLPRPEPEVWGRQLLSSEMCPCCALGQQQHGNGQY